MPDETATMRLSVYIEEYKSCRIEIQDTLKSIDKLHIFEFSFAGVLFAYITNAYFEKSPFVVNDFLGATLLAWPISFYVLALSYIPLHLRLLHNAHYINTVLRVNIVNAIGLNYNKTILGWEDYLFKHRGRPLPFVMPSLSLTEYVLDVLFPVLLLCALVMWKIYVYGYRGLFCLLVDFILVVANIMGLVFTLRTKRKVQSYYKKTPMEELF